MAEKKVMNSVNPTGTAPTETKPLTHIVNGKQVDKPKQSKFGKQPPKNTTPAQATSTAPTQPHEEGVFDNVPETKDDMITQEGGSKAGKLSMNPKSPSQIKYGRSAEYAKVKLSEDKANPTLNTSNVESNTSSTPSGFEADPDKVIVNRPTPKGEKAPSDIKSKAAEIILKTMLLKLDLMEIKKFGKNINDVPSPVTNDEDGNPTVKEFEQKEVNTDIQGNNPSTNPQHLEGGHYPGRSMRKVNPKTGLVEKVPMKKEEWN